jgi:hypothetical protein
MLPDPSQAIIAHVGDSRAYLMRGGRLSRLTTDHTVVAELVAAGKLAPDRAVDHPFASVLSRNLGGYAKTEVSISVTQLQVGDRLLLCSDGLNGYATHGAMEQVLGGADNPEAATRDLVELAKRGGGGDNVSVVVIGAESPPTDNEVVHDSGGKSWWDQREVFIRYCEQAGLANSELAAGLPPAEAVEILGGSFFEAVYHDLNSTSGVNVWTFADSLVHGWFERSADHRPIMELLDTLHGASMAVANEVIAAAPDFGVCLEIALLRSLIVAEMVVGGQASARWRQVTRTMAAAEPQDDLPDATFTSVATVPFRGANAAIATTPEVDICLHEAFELLRHEFATSDNKHLVQSILDGVSATSDDEIAVAARDLYGNQLLGEQELSNIFATLDRCRERHLELVRLRDASPEVRSTAFRIVAEAHQSLMHNLAMNVIDAGKPTTDKLHEMQENTLMMRKRVTRNDRRMADLEVALATVEDGAPL